MFVVMLTSSCTASLTKKGEVRSASHVGSSEEGANKTHNHEGVVARIAHIVDDFVLREETRKGKDPTQRKRGNDPRGECDWHVLAQTAHVFLHVKRVMRCAVANGARTQEQTCLEERVSEDVEHCGQPSTCTKTHHHVSQLTNR